MGKCSDWRETNNEPCKVLMGGVTTHTSGKRDPYPTTIATHLQVTQQESNKASLRNLERLLQRRCKKFKGILLTCTNSRTIFIGKGKIVYQNRGSGYSHKYATLHTLLGRWKPSLWTFHCKYGTLKSSLFCWPTRTPSLWRQMWGPRSTSCH